MWTETATTVLQNKFKEISAGIDDELREIRDPKERMEFVINELGKQHPHALFSHMSIPLNTKTRFQELNRAKGDPSRQWKYEELLNSGVWGMNCQNQADAFDKPYDQRDMIRTWGLTQWFFTQSGVNSKL